MGFGSYDESERDDQQIDTDLEDTDDRTGRPSHDGDVEFEYGDATSEDLLATFEEIQGR